MMTYRGYIGRAEVDTEAGIIHGRVIGLRDVVTFEAESPKEVERAFRESIDDYLAFCEELGESPEKPHSGKFNVRLSPDLHRKLVILAEVESVSLNDLIRQAAEEAVQERLDESPVGPAKGSRTTRAVSRVRVKTKATALGKGAPKGGPGKSTPKDAKASKGIASKKAFGKAETKSTTKEKDLSTK